jgi:hypothetical protein
MPVFQGQLYLCRAVIMNISTFWDITPCSPFKDTDISEEYGAFFIRVE